MKLRLLPFIGAILVTFKLIGTITWSWWWVLLPFYGPLILVLLLIGAAAATK